MNFRLSFFKHKADAMPQAVVRNWREFCALLTSPEARADKDGPLFSPATFDPKTRANDNVTEPPDCLALYCLGVKVSGGAEPCSTIRLPTLPSASLN